MLRSETALLKRALVAQSDLVRRATRALLANLQPGGISTRKLVDRLWGIFDGPKALKADELRDAALGLPDASKEPAASTKMGKAVRNGWRLLARDRAPTPNNDNKVERDQASPQGDQPEARRERR